MHPKCFRAWYDMVTIAFFYKLDVHHLPHVPTNQAIIPTHQPIHPSITQSHSATDALTKQHCPLSLMEHLIWCSATDWQCIWQSLLGKSLSWVLKSRKTIIGWVVMLEMHFSQQTWYENRFFNRRNVDWVTIHLPYNCTARFSKAISKFLIKIICKLWGKMFPSWKNLGSVISWVSQCHKTCFCQKNPCSAWL